MQVRYLTISLKLRGLKNDKIKNLLFSVFFYFNKISFELLNMSLVSNNIQMMNKTAPKTKLIRFVVYKNSALKNLSSYEYACLIK